MEDSSPYELRENAAGRYLARLSRILRAAHLGAQYPSVSRLCSYLTALQLKTSCGLHPVLDIHPVSGLPMRHEWLRVEQDAELAESILATLPTEEAVRERASPESVAEQLIKWRYWSQLRPLALTPIEPLRVELRRVDHESGVLYVRVVHDRLDEVGRFVRYTIEFGEVIKALASQQLLLQKEVELSATAKLRGQLSLLAELGAESIFLELGALHGVTMQRVCKATVGPFCTGELPTGLPFGHLLKSTRGTFATFAIDVAAQDITRDDSNDPLPHLLLETGAADTLSLYERSRIKFGYRVYRDRKFVTDPTTQVAVEGLCHEAGTRNIIYVVPSGQDLQVSP